VARARPDRQRAKLQKQSAAGLIGGDTSASIGRLLGQPLTPVDTDEESPAERILLLQQRLRDLDRKSRPQQNPYQADFKKFLFELCWTADEARGGKVARVPEYPYLHEVCDALIECDLLLFSKSRRVLASWVCCCYDLWIAAGGQDPRWPQLLNATGNRQVFVGDRKFDSAAKFLKRRHQFILNAFRENDYWRYWPEFPTWETREGEVEFSNNSVITAVAQGSDQLRGPGATLAHLEEIAFWEQAQQTVEGLLPIVQGGGHVVAVTTPNAASYAKRIIEGRLNEARSYR
jgi:hypothetical protein